MQKNTQGNNVLKKYDYEKYQIIMPFTAIAGKKRKQFLCSELEKMHPCFSDEYAFDSEIKKISRKGLSTDVLVMNKFKLAEYEGKRRFSGSGFYINDKEDVMSENLRHRYFVNKKWKITVWSIIGCSLIGCIGLISGVLASVSGELKSNNQETAFEVTEAVPVEENIKSDSLYEKDFFEAVTSASGIIKNFEWKFKDFSKTIRAAVRGIYPEDLSVIHDSTVVYENGIPQMNLFFTHIIPKKENLVNLETVLSNSDFNKKLRETITKYGAVLKEENAPPYHIEFICNDSDKTKKLFAELAQIIRDDNRTVTYVSLNPIDVQKIQAGISIETIPLPETGFDLNLISENLKLFFDNSVVNKVYKTGTVVRTDGAELNVHVIGEIKRADNSIVVFYKTPEGKIQKRIKSEGEEK